MREQLVPIRLLRINNKVIAQSRKPQRKPNFSVQMAKPTNRTTLYRLIEAGHLARQAVLLPLVEHNLLAGDDAILLAIAETGQLDIDQLCDVTGFPRAALDERLTHLGREDLIVLSPDTLITLTGSGSEIAARIRGHWKNIEAALTGELKHADHKKLRRTLKRFSALLNLQD